METEEHLERADPGRDQWDSKGETSSALSSLRWRKESSMVARSSEAIGGNEKPRVADSDVQRKKRGIHEGEEIRICV